LESLLERLDSITTRLERTVPLLETTLEPLTRSIVVTKSLEELLDEHLTPTEKEKISDIISDRLISPDSSADLADLSDRDFIPQLPIDLHEVESRQQFPDEVPNDNVDIDKTEKHEEDLIPLESEREIYQLDSQVQTENIEFTVPEPACNYTTIETLISTDESITIEGKIEELDCSEALGFVEIQIKTDESEVEKFEEFDRAETLGFVETQITSDESETTKDKVEESDCPEKLDLVETEIFVNREELSDTEHTNSGSGDTDVSSESPATVVFEIPPPLPVLDLIVLPDIVEMTNSELLFYPLACVM